MDFNASNQPKQPVSLRLLIAVCVALIVCGGVMTAAAYTLAQHRIARQAGLKLKQISTGHVHELAMNLETYSDLLYSTKGLFAAAEVGATAWHRFVHSQSAPDRYLGLRAIAYAEIVPQELIKDHERSLQSGQHPDIQIHPLKNTGDYAVLTYMEEVELPDAERVGVLGMDLLSNPDILDATQRADNSGTVAATRKINMLTSENPGFLLILPLADHAGTQAPDSGTFGYAIAAVRINDFIKDTLDERLKENQTGLTIKDVTGGGSEVLFQNQQPDPGSARKNQMTMQIADRTWELTFQVPASSLLIAAQRFAPIGALIVGIGFMAAMSAIVYMLRLRCKVRNLN